MHAVGHVTYDNRLPGERWVHRPPGYAAHAFDQCAALGHKDPRDPEWVDDGVPRLMRDENRQTEQVQVV